MNKAQEVIYLKSKYRKLTIKNRFFTMAAGLFFIFLLVLIYITGPEFTLFNVGVGAVLACLTCYFFIKSFNIETDQLSEVEAKLDAYGESPTSYYKKDIGNEPREKW